MNTASIHGRVLYEYTDLPSKDIELLFEVRDENSQPLPKCDTSITTEPDGNFRVEFNFTGAKIYWQVSTKRPHYNLPTNLIASFCTHYGELQSGENKNITLHLEKTKYMKGRITDEANKPIADATLLAIAMLDNGYQYLEQAQSNADGNYELFHNPPTPPPDATETLLRVEHPDFTQVVVDDLYRDEDTQQIVMPRGQSARGQLLNANSKPLANQTVSILTPDYEKYPRTVHKKTQTGSNGQFQIDGLNQGEYTLQAFDATNWQAVKQEITIANKDIDAITLHCQKVNLPKKITEINGVLLADIDNKTAGLLGITKYKGVMVVELKPDHMFTTLCASPHIKPGDHIWMIGEQVVSNTKELLGALTAYIKKEDKADSCQIVYMQIIEAGSMTNHFKLTQAAKKAILKL